VNAGLHGRLRMRCWSKGEDRPSVYTDELKMPRGDNLQAVAGTPGGTRRVGPPPSTNYWGPLKEPPKGFGATLTKNASALASIPYDVPRAYLINGLAEAGLALHDLYEGALGIPGGGSGLCFGLRIDHVLLAIAEGDITSTAKEPLMALMEVAYKDTLLPMVDTVVVLQHEWTFALEKVAGLIAQVLAYRSEYERCTPQLRSILLVMVEVYETMHQCEEQMMLALQLTDSEHSPAVKASLHTELVERLCAMLWRLSTEALRLMVDAGERKAVVPNVDAAMRMQVISHLTETMQEKQKVGTLGKITGAFSGWLSNAVVQSAGAVTTGVSSVMTHTYDASMAMTHAVTNAGSAVTHVVPTTLRRGSSKAGSLLTLRGGSFRRGMTFKK